MGVVEGEEHPVLREQERAEADVGALLAEELPELIAQMVVEHGYSPCFCPFISDR
jgi:seryl-tRNA synthetase